MRLRTLVVILTLVAAAANGQPQRVFVSSNGNDAGPCNRPAPCRNFAAALAVVQDGGEVIVLDSAGYGPVTINKSVSVIAPGGVYAGITATSGAAITINAPSATVVLRGLSLNGQGAAYGIYTTGLSALHVESCVISRFNNMALLVSGNNSKIFVDDTIARDNAGEGFTTYAFLPNDVITMSIDRSRAENNAGDGIFAQGNGTGTMVNVHDTLCAKNGIAGIRAYSAELNVMNCVSTNNHQGVSGSNSSTVTVSDSLVADNDWGLDNSGGTFQSFGTNQVTGNVHATNGTITPVSRQ